MTQKSLVVEHFYNPDGTPFYQIVRYVPGNRSYDTTLQRSTKVKDIYRIHSRSELESLRDTIDEALSRSSTPTFLTPAAPVARREEPSRVEITPATPNVGEGQLLPDDYVIDLTDEMLPPADPFKKSGRKLKVR